MKILYLLFAVFFLVLQSFPGFTRSDPKNIKECLKAGGICFPFGCPFSKRIGRCSPGIRCCKKKDSPRASITPVIVVVLGASAAVDVPPISDESEVVVLG
ncbi:defensin beta 4A-like [Malaclemys terrapin pileata]|uniref:defensin beta 4A-like n=1 Tax=Malaclemys terrapin pileata TaxID=2991368 RepID=UPI0023A7DA9B|nr:defensin beta 4A-like [Malaclemys terrapin pileata]